MMITDCNMHMVYFNIKQTCHPWKETINHEFLAHTFGRSRLKGIHGVALCLHMKKRCEM